MDSADIILMRSDLMDVVTAIRLSRAVIRNIKQNLNALRLKLFHSVKGEDKEPSDQENIKVFSDQKVTDSKESNFEEQGEN